MQTKTPDTQTIPIHVRHIKPGQGTNAVTVLNQVFIPDRRGVNGGRGFQQGQLDWRLNEEGQMTVTFPNASGEDGTLHRDRFLIVQKGSITPLGGNLLLYKGGNYRPGDEWLEVWEGPPPVGTLLFVGTPTAATLSTAQLDITLYDGYWLTKKSRTTAADFWNHAPRDVFETYTGCWVPLVADDFITTGVWTWSANPVTSADNKWSYLRVETDPANPGVVLMHPRGTPAGSVRSSITAVKNITAAADLNLRCEATVRLNQSNGTQLYIGLWDNTASTWALWFGQGPAAAASNAYSVPTVGTVAQKQVVKTPGRYRIAFEVRNGRWIFLYVDSALVAVAPFTTPMGNSLSFMLFADSLDYASEVAVENILVRQLQPYLMRGTNKGDLAIPGSQPPGGLIGNFYDFGSLKGVAGIQYRIFDPTMQPYARRQDPIIQYGPTGDSTATGSQLQPAGAANGEYWGCRWTGSIYLDLDNYDYSFQAVSNDRCRVWIGNTKTGTQIIDDWTALGHVMSGVISSWVKGGAALGGTSGPLYGQHSGWYPIVIEYSNDAAGGGCVVTYQRSDQLGLWVPLGATAYDHKIRSYSSLVHYYPLSDGSAWWNNNVVRDMAPNGPNIINLAHFSANSTWQTGGQFTQMLAGSYALDFDGTNSALWQGAPYDTPTGAFTLEAWVVPDSGGGSTQSRTIIGKENSFLVRIEADGSTTGTWSFYTYQNSTWIRLAGPAVVLSQVAHVVATFSGGTKRLYINGVKVAESTGNPAAVNNGNNAFYIGGRQGTAGAQGEWFDGRINKIAIYNTQLQDADVAANYAAGIATTQHVMLSPLGVFSDNIRYESFYDQIQNLNTTFGLQFRCEPRSLESGLFPGEMVPRVRYGRDTQKVLDGSEAISVQTQIDATGVADAIQADGSGTSDPNNQATVFYEGINFDQVDQHLFVMHEYQSLSDITFLNLLEQRIMSYLGLAGSPWEQVQAQPKGFTELLDRFPIPATPDLQKFAWTPGDGVRLSLNDIGVSDNNPRQILGVQWVVTPDGKSTPSVSFRQRSRGFPDLLRKFMRAAVSNNRNYQGSLETRYGGNASNPAGNMGDTYSRVVLPANIRDVVRATVVVTYKGDTSPWDLYVNGTSRIVGITRPGRYDITPWLGSYPDAAHTYEMYTQILAQASGSTSTVEHVIELVCKI